MTKIIDFIKRKETIASAIKLLKEMNASETYFYVNNIALDIVNGENGEKLYQLLKNYFEPNNSVDS